MNDTILRFVAAIALTLTVVGCAAAADDAETTSDSSLNGGEAAPLGTDRIAPAPHLPAAAFGRGRIAPPPPVGGDDGLGSEAPKPPPALPSTRDDRVEGPPALCSEPPCAF